MKKVLLVCALVLCFINLGKVFALDDQGVDLYDQGTSIEILSLGMFNNRLYTSTVDDSIYWVIDKVTFNSQQYWYVYDQSLTAWVQPIDTQYFEITEFYSYLDIEETIIIFNVKLWETSYLSPWGSSTAIGIFTTNSTSAWKNLNGMVYTYYFDTIEDLVINLNATRTQVNFITSESYTEGYTTGETVGHANGYDTGYGIGHGVGYTAALIELDTNVIFENGKDYGILVGYEEAVKEIYYNGFDDIEYFGRIYENDKSWPYYLGYDVGYDKGVFENISGNFTDNLDKWIVPAIATVIIAGGIMSVISIKRRKEDL